MSPMTNEIKCYICMISCIFIEQIFMVVYTMSKCTSHNCLIMKMKEKKKTLSLSSVSVNIQFL